MRIFRTLLLTSIIACSGETKTQNSNSMQLDAHLNGTTYRFDSEIFHDLSIPIDTTGPLAWYLNEAQIEAVRDENWVGVVAEGGSVNFRNIHFNPHGHGTHTEGPGHVESEVHSIDRAVKSYHELAVVISVEPRKLENGDQVIYWDQLEEAVLSSGAQAVILRTSSEDRRHTNWSNTNPPYLDADAAAKLAEQGVLHLLLDLPSVDRESDGGKLAAHKAYWQIPSSTRYNATITELIYVPVEVVDGIYLLNLQIGPFVNDAAPSRPVIYPIQEI